CDPYQRRLRRNRSRWSSHHRLHSRALNEHTQSVVRLVSAIDVSEGEQVKTGQLLVKIDVSIT
ncbi:MAG: hypothetical protein WBF62_00160, partial [Bradyrhizobium sp.]